MGTEHAPVMYAAGSPLPDAEAHIHRYCGVPDEHGRREVWAYEFYDALPSPSDTEVVATDVLATAALNMRFTQACLQGWVEARPAIREALSSLPADSRFEDASDDEVEAIEDVLMGFSAGEGPFAHKIPDADRTMVSKVLHRKRPRLIPLYDRVISDHYVRGLKDKIRGRGLGLLHSMRDDLRDERTAQALEEIQARLASALEGRPLPSRLRLFDIAIWMSTRGP